MFFDINKAAINAANSEKERNLFIEKNERFIKNTAAKFSKKYVSSQDDEWSMALIGFSNAIDTYDVSKGNFLSYARLLIEHKLTDYFRSQARFFNEIQTDPVIFNGENEDSDVNLSYKLTVTAQLITPPPQTLTDEIEALRNVLNNFKFDFFDLTSCSPKAKKTKVQCQKAIRYLRENEDLIENMRRTKMLPIKTIMENTKIPRKILERYRKYIIAATEILSGDYPGLAEYLKEKGE